MNFPFKIIENLSIVDICWGTSMESIRISFVFLNQICTAIIDVERLPEEDANYSFMEAPSVVNASFVEAIEDDYWLEVSQACASWVNREKEARGVLIMSNNQIIHASFFSGLGGGDLAAEMMGWHNAFHCEINPFCRQVLDYYWPESYKYEDITRSDFSIWRGRIHVLSGGFPCQGFSLAGKRMGTQDARYLWPAMLRGIDIIRPPWVIGENVTGILSMEDKSGVWREVFPQVENRQIVRYREVDHYEALYTRQAKMLVTSICEDLEKAGYQVQPVAIPAGATGAPHKRERIFFIAHSEHNGLHATQVRGDDQESSQQTRKEEKRQPERADSLRSDDVANTDSIRLNGSKESEKVNSRGVQKRLEKGHGAIGLHEPGATTHTQSYIDGHRLNGEVKIFRSASEKNERIGKSLQNFDNWPTQSPVCGGDDGLPTQLDGITFSKWRNESIKGYGNAIVPQALIPIFEPIDEHLKTHLSAAGARVSRVPNPPTSNH